MLLKVIRLLNVPSLGLKLVLRKGLTVDFFVMWYRAAPDPHNKVGPNKHAIDFKMEIIFTRGLHYCMPIAQGCWHVGAGITAPTCLCLGIIQHLLVMKV